MISTFIIAEAGVNHNGDMDRAVEMIDVAVDTGSDAIKFQSFKADRVATERAEKCSYQELATGSGGSQREMLQALELSLKDHVRLADHCATRGIEFMSTPFDPESLIFLVNKLDMRRIKIPSGELVNPILLLEAARSRRPLILSTGLANLEEVEIALGVIAYGLAHPTGFPGRADIHASLGSGAASSKLAESLTILHCVSDYPAAPQDVNLRAMKTMADKFTIPVGLSDHTAGITVSIAAVAMGATVIEKHFTLDKDLPGPDHKASLSPSELRDLVVGIRMVEMAMGSGVKAPGAKEAANKTAIRGSLVATDRISAGAELTLENVTVKRPGDGLSPMDLLDLYGTPASRDYENDEQI